jgi:hypothetical protein
MHFLRMHRIIFYNSITIITTPIFIKSLVFNYSFSQYQNLPGQRFKSLNVKSYCVNSSYKLSKHSLSMYNFRALISKSSNQLVMEKDSDFP